MNLRFVLSIALGLAVLAPQSASEIDKARKTIKAQDIQRHQAFLASDELEGREAGTDGGHRAAMHIADHLAALGIEGGASDGGYFQCFGGGNAMGEMTEVNYARQFKDAARKTFEEFKYGEDFAPHARSRGGAIEASLVFAGYGITASEHEYDDWKGAGAKGAVALVLDGEPQEADAASKFDGAKPTKYSDLAHKIEMAEKAGAVALLVASREGLAKRAEFAWPPPADAAPARIPVALVSAAAADKLAGKPLADVRTAIDSELKTKTFKATKPVGLAVSARPRPGKGTKNVLGLWRGTDSKLKTEFVVIGAHYDHVGKTGYGSRTGKKEIHNGADDNASGTSTLLDLAEALVLTKPKRSVLLIWFDAEEKGLVGSKHWCDSPTVPIESVAAMFNMDMVGRNERLKIMVGVEKDGKDAKYAKLAALLGEGEKHFKLRFDWSGADEFIQRSDHWHFMEKGVPAAFFFGGLHADYHTENDDVQKINFQKEELIGQLVFWLACRTAGSKLDLR